MAKENHPPPWSLMTPPSTIEQPIAANPRKYSEESAESLAALILLDIQRKIRENQINPPSAVPQGDAAVPSGEGDAPVGNMRIVPPQGANQGQRYGQVGKENHPPLRSWRMPPSTIETTIAADTKRAWEESAESLAASILLDIQRKIRENQINPPSAVPQGDAAVPPGEGDAPGGNRYHVPPQGTNQGQPLHTDRVGHQGDGAG
ncbi:uncharacterized protein LOC124171734 [Ischnura elegans]|uniref:uncharacterized protein LOC124171734 n=1 Tax=Ischnura elegans TaxID=197161 RepID=UPI001ED86E28|nr:uncharacterized protein LOC124171734 [Ischnura elegans]XP_046406966.1 uncharacterized protein LOC124171734 [Ischnura elegans]